MRSAFIVVMLGIGTLTAQISGVPEFLPRVPLGTVHGLASSADEVFAVGEFSTVGRPLVNLALVNSASGLVLAAPELNGDVYTIIGDGTGGWYVGGSFTTAAGVPRAGLAHFLSNGSLDPTFSVPVTGQVSSMELVGNTLFISGRFSAVGGFARDGLAVVDTAIVAVLPVSFGDLTLPVSLAAWVPLIGVHALAVIGNTLYVAGFFEGVSGVARHGFAAFDSTTGALLPWFPSFGSRQFGVLLNTVSTTANAGLLRPLRGELFLSDAARTSLASVHPISGAPSANIMATNGPIWTAVDDGSTLYLGGEFSTILGTARNRIAAFDLTSGNLLPFSATISAGRITTMVIEGSYLHIGGQFGPIVGTNTSNYARLDRLSGSLGPPDLGLTGWVNTMALGPGSLILGGRIAGVDGVPREGIAAFDAGSGVLLPFSVDIRGQYGAVVRPRAVACRGNSVFISGLFTSVQGQPRPGLAAVDRTTGNLLPFNPPNLISNGSIPILVPGDSGLFVLNPSSISQQLTLLDATTGTPLWSVTGNQPIRDVEESPSGVFVTGLFTSLNGQAAPYMARLDATTGARLPFSGVLDGPGYGLAVAEESIFVAGAFTSANVSPRPNFAAFDPNTGAVLPWAPATPAPAPGDFLLLGPTLVTVPSLGPALAPALLDRMTGQRLSWSPPPAIPWATTIAGSRLLRGGSFPIDPDSSPYPGLISHAITLSPASSTALGFGCWSSPSTISPPSLTSNLPILGSTLTLTVEGPPLTLGALWFSLPASSPVSLGNNCFVHLDLATALELTTFITDPLGRSTRSTFLPPILSLDGLSFREQALLLPPTGFALTNALHLTLGYASP